MDQNEIKARIADLEKQIAALPAGSVTKKMIRGKLYFYHRWTENKKRRENIFLPGKKRISAPRSSCERLWRKRGKRCWDSWKKKRYRRQRARII